VLSRNNRRSRRTVGLEFFISFVMWGSLNMRMLTIVLSQGTELHLSWKWMKARVFKVIMAVFSTALGFGLAYVALNYEHSPIAVDQWVIKTPIKVHIDRVPASRN